MRFLVFSDSHGHAERIRRAVRTQLSVGKIDRIFFLGDGIHDFLSVSNEFPTVPVSYVYGNCDDAFTTPEERENKVWEETVTAGGVTFLLMHGHKYGVKSGPDDAAFRAVEVGADIVLYGHTHRAEDTTVEIGEKTVRLINPGAVCGFSPSYALLETVGREVICGFGEA